MFRPKALLFNTLNRRIYARQNYDFAKFNETKTKTSTNTSSASIFIPCTSCKHYDLESRKCKFDYMIEDKDNYVIVGLTNQHISAVHARKNELFCGVNATKYVYHDHNMTITIEHGIIATVGWCFPVFVGICVTDSLWAFAPYIAHLWYIYREHTPTYNPHNPPTK